MLVHNLFLSLWHLSLRSLFHSKCSCALRPVSSKSVSVIPSSWPLITLYLPESLLSWALLLRPKKIAKLITPSLTILCLEIENSLSSKNYYKLASVAGMKNYPIKLPMNCIFLRTYRLQECKSDTDPIATNTPEENAICICILYPQELQIDQCLLETRCR